ncbi:unnamed protein product [Bursaphelenchus xylophilus]|uniref:(pine wood nematode) hypothetical protein n=1 Tax=Bursaphelenchus xylophilus TaxID=6326 RepID=A0A1I7SHH6_BURXY|nr:unnamed protein product [Bursaphelenchus xylophilus]CAG9125318.1 unnamed protein product [Bursaphelenchus xylophilus]
MSNSEGRAKAKVMEKIMNNNKDFVRDASAKPIREFTNDCCAKLFLYRYAQLISPLPVACCPWIWPRAAST